jgi:hypothetical protein
MTQAVGVTIVAALTDVSDQSMSRRRIREPQVRSCARIVAKQLAQLLGAFAGLVDDDLCVADVFVVFAFLVLVWVVAGFDFASFASFA